MSNIKTFQDLIVWQKSHNLVLQVYEITSIFPSEEKYGLISQMRRAAISMASNIVEGFKRRTVKDSLNFYNISAGSLDELKYQLLVSKDLKYMPEKNYNELLILAEEVSKLLTSWIRSQKTNSL